MMSSRIVILITFIALIMDRCDSSTSLDAVDSLTIAVRFEHSKALENLEHLHSFVREMLIGSSERGIERASLIEFGGGANSSPSGMVVRDLRDDDVEIEKKEKLVAEFGRKLAAIKNVGAERLTDIARRSRREKDSSAIVVVVSMTAATDPKCDVVEQKRREMRSMATRAMRNGADIAVFLNSYEKTADSQLNAVYFWKLKNSSVAVGEWIESEAATTASSIGAKILDVIDELMRERGKTRNRRNPECVEDGCYYKAANVCVVAYKNRDQCPTNNTCPKKKCIEKCADAKQWSKGKCPDECKTRKKMTPSPLVKYCPVKKPCERRPGCTKEKTGMLTGAAILFIAAILLVLALGIGFGVLIWKSKRGAKKVDHDLGSIVNPPSLTQTPMEELYKQGSKKPGSPQQQIAATFALGSKSTARMSSKSTIAKAGGGSVKADPKSASSKPDPKAASSKADPKAASVRPDAKSIAAQSSKSAKAPSPVSVKKK